MKQDRVAGSLLTPKALRNRIMIIDSHAHFEPKMLDAPSMIQKLDAAGVDRVALIPTMNDPLPESPERLLALLRKWMRRRYTRELAGAVHRLTLMAGRGDLRLPEGLFRIYQQPDNQPMFDLIAQHPERFLGWIFLNPKHNPAVLDELEKYRGVPGACGVKLHPHWHDYRTELLNPVLSRCEELQLPVLIHLGFGKRGDYRTLAEQFPKLRLIAAHAGFPFYDDMWNFAAEHNIYVDLSSPYIDEELARDAVRVMGPDRCLYGTDSPYGFHDEKDTYDYMHIRGWVERMPLSAADTDAVLGGNFLRLLSR